MSFPIICMNCGAAKEHHHKPSPTHPGKFCSLKCSTAYYAANGSSRILGLANYKVLRSWIMQYGPANKKAKIQRVCQYCKKSFLAYPYQVAQGKAQFCSKLCYEAGRFNPDLSENKRQRGTPAYKLWRSSIFQRDSFTCQSCGIKGVWVEAHHLAPWSLRPIADVSLSYGITLCRPCHMQAHGRKEKPDAIRNMRLLRKTETPQ